MIIVPLILVEIKLVCHKIKSTFHELDNKKPNNFATPLVRCTYNIAGFTHMKVYSKTEKPTYLRAKATYDIPIL